jgi:hypothetical protein
MFVDRKKGFTEEFCVGMIVVAWVTSPKCRFPDVFIGLKNESGTEYLRLHIFNNELLPMPITELENARRLHGQRPSENQYLITNQQQLAFLTEMSLKTK